MLDQTYPLIYLIENYIANGSGGSGTQISDPLLFSENMITNPQFADVYFQTPFTISSSGTYNIAPGWSLVLTGSGSTTVSQETNAANPSLPGNPAYYLELVNSGWTSVKLIQKFSNNGSIFSLGAIAVAFSAFVSPNAENITVSYVPSTGTTYSFNVFNIQTSIFAQYTQAIDIPSEDNTDTGINAYVNIVFTLPNTGTVNITNIQITGQSTSLSQSYINNPTPPSYAELTYNRMVDHEFNVYRTSLLREQKENILTGWTFSQNPYQYWPFSLTAVTTNTYTLDQTIIIQQAYVTSATGSNVNVGSSTDSNNYGMAVQAETITSQFAIFQYIDSKTCRPLFGRKVSVQVRAFISTVNSTVCRFKMRLIYNSGTIESLGQNEPVATWTATSGMTIGEPTYTTGSNGWTAIAPPNDPIYTLGNSFQYFNFDGIQLPTDPGINTVIGIIIYTLDPLSITTTADVVYFDRVSLIQNDFAIEPHSETFDENLRKCQYYYEKSYPVGTAAGTATTVAICSAKMTIGFDGSSNEFLYGSSFYLQYKQTKRTVPVIHLYSPYSGTIDKISMGIYTNGGNTSPTSGANPRDTAITNWSTSATDGNDGAVFICTATSTEILEIASGSVLAGDEGLGQYHYTIDARLGIVT